MNGREPRPGEVIRLGPEPPAPAPAPARRPGRLHALAILGMASCAIVGVLATLAFITVSWPGRIGHYIVAIIVTSAVGVVACAATAVLCAARDTYARRAEED